MKIVHYVIPMIAAICSGQSISIGAIGGVRPMPDLTGVYGFSATDESRPYIVGPSIEIGLPRSFALEFDALYQREGYTDGFFDSDNGAFDYGRERANSWHFPALLKYKIPLRRIRPFVLVGYSPRILNGTEDDGEASRNATGQAVYDPTSRFSVSWPVSQGFVAGGGVRFSIGHWEIVPQVRYVRWLSGGIYSSNALQGGAGYQSAQNEVQVLMELGWKIR